METTKVKNLKLSSDMMTAQLISSFTEETYEHKEYTAFEVFPTLNDIEEGTSSIDVEGDSGVIAPFSYYIPLSSYNIDDVVLNKSNKKIYTCIKKIEQGTIASPGTSTGNNYWKEGSRQYNCDYYLKYKKAVPKNNKLLLQFYSYKSSKNDIDIIIDWGDGAITYVNNDLNHDVISFENFKNTLGETYNYSLLFVKHTYNEQKKFIVKIYGRDYFMVRPPYENPNDNIVSRVFDPDLPVASNLINMSSFCRNSLRLLKVNPPYEYNLKNVRNIALLFSYAENLQIVKISSGMTEHLFLAYAAVFKGCVNLRTDFNDIKFLFKYPPEGLKYTSIVSETDIFGKIDDTLFWNNPLLNGKDVDSEYAFRGCNKEILSLVPYTWSGNTSTLTNYNEQKYINSYLLNLISTIKSIFYTDETIKYDDTNLTHSEQGSYIIYTTFLNNGKKDGSTYGMTEIPCEYDDTILIDTSCAIRGNAGIIAYHDDLVIKTWNSDTYVYHKDYGTLALSEMAKKLDMTTQELEKYLESTTKYDDCHWRRLNYPSEYLTIQDNKYVLKIPFGANRLVIPNLDMYKTGTDGELNTNHKTNIIRLTKVLSLTTVNPNIEQTVNQILA